jgi:hypothetical protein
MQEREMIDTTNKAWLSSAVIFLTPVIVTHTKLQSNVESRAESY